MPRTEQCAGVMHEMKKNISIRIIRNAAALICAFMVLCHLLASCSVQKAYPGAPDGMRPINDGSIGAVLFVPSYWSVDTSAVIPMGYVSTNDRSNVTLAYVSADELGGRSPQEYWSNYAEQFRAVMTDFTIVKESESAKDYSTRLIANRDAYEFEFTGTVTGLEYHYRQALLRADDGGLYLITYSATEEKYSTHLDILFDDIYGNFTFTSDILSVEDNNTLPPDGDEGVSVPDGMQLISNGAVDYLMFVPESWSVQANTGISSARVSETDASTVSAIAFSSQYSWREEFRDLSETDIRKKLIDEFWSSRETDISDTFGGITYTSESKFTDTSVDGYYARTYAYSLRRDSDVYSYRETVLIRDNYVYIITYCSRLETADLHISEYERIISEFRFK